MTSFWKRRKQADFTAEIESHIRIEAEQLCEEGVSAPDARDRRFACRRPGSGNRATCAVTL